MPLRSPTVPVATLVAALAALASAQPAVLVAEVASGTTFRLGVRFGGLATSALSTPSVNAGAPAASTPVAWGGMSGVATSFGALLTDGASRWALYDAANNTLVASGDAPPSLNNGSSSDAGIVLPVSGVAAASGPTRQCLGNGYFGPTFYYNRAAASFAFAVSAWDYDPAQHHCYPVSFSGSVGTAARERDMCSNTKSETDVSNAVRSDKFPDGLSNTTLAGCCAACESDPSCTAYVWSDGSVPDPNGSECPRPNANPTLTLRPRTPQTHPDRNPPPPAQPIPNNRLLALQELRVHARPAWPRVWRRAAGAPAAGVVGHGDGRGLVPRARFLAARLHAHLLRADRSARYPAAAWCRLHGYLLGVQDDGGGRGLHGRVPRWRVPDRLVHHGL